MGDLADALRDPISLAPNRVPRFYRGGRLLGAFRGDLDARDDDSPEDWVGSATRAWTPPGVARSTLGLSEVRIGDELLTLEAALVREPEALIGPALLARSGPTLGLLVKLLDAGERLPVHCHPTRDAARTLLGSPFGKTEAWLILATRTERTSVWAGFRESVTPATLRRWIDDQEADVLLDALVEHPVSAGDAFLIPAGIPHAIGPGIFLLELQEPTDFSVVAETRGFPVSSDDASLGLGWETAVGFFETGIAGELRQAPARDGDGVTPVLGPAADPYFRALRLTVTGEAGPPVEPTFAIGVVVSGSGEVAGATASLHLERGVTFALAAAAMPHVRFTAEAMELLLCLPPVPDLAPAA